MVTLSSFSVASSVSVLAATLGFCPIFSPWVVHSKRVLGTLQHTRVLLPSYGSDRDGDSAAGMVLALAHFMTSLNKPSGKGAAESAKEPQRQAQKPPVF